MLGTDIHHLWSYLHDHVQRCRLLVEGGYITCAVCAGCAEEVEGGSLAAVIILDLWVQPTTKEERALSYWRDQWVFRSHRLHTLEFFGYPSSLPYISRVFERSLPHPSSRALDTSHESEPTALRRRAASCQHAVAST